LKLRSTQRLTSALPFLWGVLLLVLCRVDSLAELFFISQINQWWRCLLLINSQPLSNKTSSVQVVYSQNAFWVC